MTEYGDPQCSVCKLFSEQVAPDLISSEVKTGNVKYDYQPYLIIGPDSKPAMRAALAAGEQGRFWNYLQLFYSNQGGENSGYVTDDFLTSIAKAAGVPDIDKWNQSRNDSKWDAIIQGRDPGRVLRLQRHPVPRRPGPEGPEGDRRQEDPDPPADPGGDPAGQLGLP